MSRGKDCVRTVSRQFLTRNYPGPDCLLKCLPNCLSPTREGFFPSFKLNPVVRVIARQLRDNNCLAAIFALRHQNVSSGPLGSHKVVNDCEMTTSPLGHRQEAKIDLTMTAKLQQLRPNSREMTTIAEFWSDREMQRP